MDHYNTLGLEFGAAPEQIKAAFRKLALAHHPDRHVTAGDAERAAAAARFKAVTEAYEVLSDDRKRAAYQASSGPGRPSTSYSTSSPHYGYGYGSSASAEQSAHMYNSRHRVSVWHALSRGIGARKLEVAVFSALTGAALAVLLSIDTIWAYKNKGKAFGDIDRSVRTSLVDGAESAQGVTAPPRHQEVAGTAVKGCSSRSRPYSAPYPMQAGGQNPASLSLAQLVALEEEAMSKQASQ